MARGNPRGTGTRAAVMSALLVALTSQIYISLFAVDFKISVAIVLLPVLVFLWPDLHLLSAALLSVPGVFLLRLVFQPSADGALASGLRAHGPEMFFYLCYGLLLCLYLWRVPLRPVRAVKFLPLIAIDAAANFAELLARLGGEVFSASLLLPLLGVGALRAMLAWGAVRALDAYGVQVLRREDAERYQRLLLMTASLKSEVAWMERGTALIERTMNTAYHLYSHLRDEGGDPAATGAALTIAKDIHEVKKEYFLIMRGISEALEADMDSAGMDLDELLRILAESTGRTARAAGKEIVFTANCADRFHTPRHQELISIFSNLLTNAVEAAAGDRPARLWIREWSEGDCFCFQVADDCGGVPPALGAQLFTPGFSTKIDPATGVVSRGLGLCLVKDLVEEKLKGTICAEAAGGGTVFTLHIPKEELEVKQDADLSR